MSEELFGGPALERDAGFTPMEPPQPSEPQDIGSDSSSLRDAAHELTEARDAREAPPDVIEYKKPDKHGRPTQERTDPKETVTRERAARDLAAMREAKSKAEEREAEAAVRDHVDNLKRGGPGTIQNQNANNNQQPQWSPAQQAAQANLNASYQQGPMHGYEQTAQQMRSDPQWTPALQTIQKTYSQEIEKLHEAIGQAHLLGQDSAQLEQRLNALHAEKEPYNQLERVTLAVQQYGVDPEVAIPMYGNPKVFAHHMEAVNAVQEVYEDKLQTMQKDAQDVLNFNVALMTHGIPELLHCDTPEKIANAIDIIRLNNPTRGQAIQSWFNGLKQAAAQAFRVNQEVEQAKQTKLQNYQAREDATFRNRHPEFRSVEVQTKAANACMEYLQHLGLSKENVLHLQNTDATFRHNAFQETLYRAMRHWRAEQTVAGKRAPAAPVHVMRPGSGEDRIDADRSEKLPESISGVKEAARILQNRRARR